MSKSWFTADLHLGHWNIIRYCNRPFTSVEEMDNTIIDRINEKVAQHDTLFILGDFAFSKDRDHWLDVWDAYRNRIDCKNIIHIAGNHDPHYRSYEPKTEMNYVFQHVALAYMVRLSKAESPEIMPWEKAEEMTRDRQIYLHHYACRVWPHSHHGAWHLYGHSHGSLPDDPKSLSFDCGVDCWNFYPIDAQQIAARMAGKLWRPFLGRES